MDLEPVRIVADDREKVGGVVAELGRRPDVSLEVRRLEIGDYVVANAVVVERKTIGDFAASVIDARLFRQAGALIQAKLRPALVLEGSSGGIRDRVTLSREAMQGALITVSLFYGLAILRARDPAETAWLLVCLGPPGAAICPRRPAPARVPPERKKGPADLPVAGLAGHRTGTG